MTKTDIIRAINEATGFQISVCGEAVETVLEVIRLTLETGENVQLSGF